MAGLNSEMLEARRRLEEQLDNTTKMLESPGSSSLRGTTINTRPLTRISPIMLVEREDGRGITAVEHPKICRHKSIGDDVSQDVMTHAHRHEHSGEVTVNHEGAFSPSSRRP